MRADLLQRFGGHKVAAGLMLESGRIRELRQRVNDFADERLGPDDLRPRLRIDQRLDFRDLTAKVASEIVGLATRSARGIPSRYSARTASRSLMGRDG